MIQALYSQKNLGNVESSPTVKHQKRLKNARMKKNIVRMTSNNNSMERIELNL